MPIISLTRNRYTRLSDHFVHERGGITPNSLDVINIVLAWGGKHVVCGTAVLFCSTNPPLIVHDCYKSLVYRLQ